MAIDMAKVEKARLLHAMKKQLGCHEKTIRRYLQLEDEPSKQAQEDQERQKHLKRYMADAWEIVHKGNERMKEALDAGGVKALDVAKIVGISVDKMNLLIATYGVKETRETSSIMIVLPAPDEDNGNNPSNSGSLPDAKALPPLAGEISSDGVRSGVGEDVLGLSGVGQDGAGVPGDRGCDSGIDLPQPEGLHPPDDPDGVMAKVGD
jgi:hypothetical protein